jgi:hypothetical protein
MRNPVWSWLLTIGSICDQLYYWLRTFFEACFWLALYLANQTESTPILHDGRSLCEVSSDCIYNNVYL